MDILIILLILIYLVIATLSDIKTQEIPDSLNYSFISIGIFVYLLKTISTGENVYLMSSLATLGIFFILGNIMYYTKQWGGGDSKLLMSLGALLPLYPEIILENFQIRTSYFLGIDLFLNILLIGSVYALIFAFCLAIKNRDKFTKKFKENYKKKKIRTIEKISWIALTLINIIGYFFLQSNIQKIFLLLISILFLLLNYLIIAIKSLEAISMYITIETKKLREGDYITKELKEDNKIIYSPIVHGVKKEQIKEIQKYFEKVEIKNGMPFAPSFLIGTIITLLIGNIFLYLLP